MNKTAYLLAGMIVGSGLTYWSLDITTPNEAQEQIASLSKELVQAKRQQAELQKQVNDHQADKFNSANNKPSSNSNKQIMSEEDGQVKLDQLSSNSFETTYQQALEYLSSEEVEEAQKVLNKLLAEAKNDEEREKVVEALSDSYRKIISHLASMPGQNDAQLWLLFEIHKLQPNTGIRQEIIAHSNIVFEEANRLKSEGNKLESADHFASLMMMSKMLDFELNSPEGLSLGTSEFEAALKKIQAQQHYLTDLKARATTRLYNGTDIDKAFVFWDYTTIASLDPDADLRQGVFREEFIQATLLHLKRLNDMNQTGEIKSRMDYIRWSFSPLLSDERLKVFL